MADDNYLKAVREQYENYPYPPINPEDERVRFYGSVIELFDRLNYFCYGGKKDFTKGFRTLIAGGGTGDAVITLAEQLRDTNADIVYIDMSEASMKVAQARARVRGLSNITWIRDSLLNIPALDLGKFDYINSSGVLHHLENPDLGLKTLSDALKDDGAMGLMLYAPYGRMAVYQMQDALRRINANEPNLQKRVDNAKAILSHLPSTNWLYHSPMSILAEIAAGDIAIYDLLLHTQDRAYSIPELYAFLDRANLQIVRLFSDDPVYGNLLYSPDPYIKNMELRKQVHSLPMREQQAIAELLNGKIMKHTFYAAKQVIAPPSPENLDMIALFGFDIYSEQKNMLELMAQDNPIVEFHQSSTGVKMQLPKSPHLAAIIARIDGKRSLREIYRDIMNNPSTNKLKPNFQSLSVEFLAIYSLFNAYNWLFLRAPDSAPVLYSDSFQARIA